MGQGLPSCMYATMPLCHAIHARWETTISNLLSITPIICNLLFGRPWSRINRLEVALPKGLGQRVSQHFSHAPKQIGGQRYAPNIGTKGQTQHSPFLGGCRTAHVDCAGVHRVLQIVKFFVENHHMEPRGVLCRISTALRICIYV